MAETAFAAEVDLQELLARHPGLLPGDQIDPESPRRWLLVGREVSVPDAAGGVGQILDYAAHSVLYWTEETIPPGPKVPGTYPGSHRRPGIDPSEGKWYFPSMATLTTFLTLDKKGRTTLPEEVRQALGVGAGDFLLLERTDRGTYELVPATLVPNDQLWFHHPEMQIRVRRAEEEIASGGSTRTETPAEAQAFLDSLKTKPHQRH